MLISIFFLAVAALLASGIIFSHRHILTYIAAAAGLWEAAWLALTLLSRTVFTGHTDIVFPAGAAVLLIGSLFWARYRKPMVPLGRAKHDLIGEFFILVVTSAVLLGSFFVMRSNGFNEHQYITHGFYNGDVATFTALVNRSFFEETLVTKNPFAANGALEYPTLLHTAVAHLLGSAGSGWIILLPAMTYITIFATVPLFFLVWEQDRETGNYPRWLPLVLVPLILTASWDSYIYPQSHFFITGLLLLAVALLQQATVMPRAFRTIVELVAATVTFVLLLSNAVYGTAAAAVLAAYVLWQATMPDTSASRRNWSWVALAGIAAAFLLFAPGVPAFGSVSFSYSAAFEMLRLAPLLALFITGLFLAAKKRPEAITLPTILMAFGFITFFFSQRDIVVANSGRFFYLALLVAFPLMAEPSMRAFNYIQTHLRKTKDIVPRLTAWVLVGASGTILLMPSVASIASAYDNLLLNDTQIVDTGMRTALWWIEDMTAPDAVFLASPYSPFSIPALTGRALLRSDDFWLSPQDVVLADTRAAFAGDIAAREHVYPLANYLLLTQAERGLFEPLPSQHTKVFDNNAIVIYRLAE